MSISPQGYNYGSEPKSEHPFWDAIKNIISKITGTASVDDTTGTPSVVVTKTEEDDAINFDFAFSGLKGEKGDTGEQGPQGEQGPAGADGAAGPDYNAVTASTLTNEDGVYTLKNTMHDGTEQEVGTIEVPEVDTENVLAEINDEVVADDTNGYDFHTLKETEYNGTVNEAGSFYLAQQQAIKAYNNTSGVLQTGYIDQNGNITTHNSIETRVFPDGTYCPSLPVDNVFANYYSDTVGSYEFLRMSVSRLYNALTGVLTTSNYDLYRTIRVTVPEATTAFKDEDGAVVIKFTIGTTTDYAIGYKYTDEDSNVIVQFSAAHPGLFHYFREYAGILNFSNETNYVYVMLYRTTVTSLTMTSMEITQL